MLRFTITLKSDNRGAGFRNFLEFVWWWCNATDRKSSDVNNLKSLSAVFRKRGSATSLCSLNPLRTLGVTVTPRKLYTKFFNGHVFFFRAFFKNISRRINASNIFDSYLRLFKHHLEFFSAKNIVNFWFDSYLNSVGSVCSHVSSMRLFGGAFSKG